MPDHNDFDLADAADRLRVLAVDWADNEASERSSFQSWLIRVGWFSR